MHLLLLWDDGYFLNSIAPFFLLPALVLGAVLLTIVVRKSNQPPPLTQAVATSKSMSNGCTVLLAIAVAILFGLYFFIKWLALPYYLR